MAAWWQRASWDQINEEGAIVLAIDIFVGDAWQGRGAGSEAMWLLIRYLTEERGHHRITVDPAAANARAIHVYEGLGFRRVGIMHAYERTKDGVWRDALLVELVVEPSGGEGA